MCVVNMLSRLVFFFFKQKTAYEMRISDWSSDVALPIYDTIEIADRLPIENRVVRRGRKPEISLLHHVLRTITLADDWRGIFDQRGPMRQIEPQLFKIGRASCRERVCQYV